jgi:type I restriction enzyme S subunit
MAAVAEESGAIDFSQRRRVADVRKGFVRFREGDVIFAKITPCMENGKTAPVVGVDGSYAAGSTEFHVLRPQCLDVRYLWYWLVRRAFRSEAEHNMSGSAGQLRVPADYLRQSSIPVAPLPEQRRIVARIDELFAELTEGEAALERAQAGLDTWRRALLKAAVTGELTRDWRETNQPVKAGADLLADIQKVRAVASKTTSDSAETLGPMEVEALPRLPRNWIWARAAQLCGFITKGTTPKANNFCSKDEGIPFIKVYNLTTTGDLDFSIKPSFVKPDIHRGFLARSVVRPDDVLMNIVGPPLGKVSIVPNTYPEWNCNQAVAIFRPILVSARWMALMLSSETILSWATRRAKATAGQFNLTLEICRDIPIPVPPLEEQSAILEIMAEQFGVGDSTRTCLNLSEIDVTKLRQSILKSAFEGRLIPQDPNDEPASVFLARLRTEAAEAPSPRRTRGRKLAP